MSARWLAVVLVTLTASACGVRDEGPGAAAPSLDATLDTTLDTAATAPDSTTLTPATEAPVTATPTDDPANEYLPDTDVVYERVLDDGMRVVVRRSRGSYADLFGLTWRGPTGDATTCLGARALLTGIPDTPGWWGSSWTANRWYPDDTPHVRLVGALSVDPRLGASQLFTVATDASTGTARLVSDVGLVDEAPVVDGIAVLVTRQALDGSEVVQVDGDDGVSRQRGYNEAWEWPPQPAACSPGPPPTQPLPPAGPQPSDAGAADEVRTQLARAVDPTVPWSDKADTLDDVTGVADAAARARDGQFADQARSASYTIDELVFSSPTEAWFRYTITTNVSSYTGRIGRAVIVDGTWRITRATLCQDLAFALSPCEPSSSPVQLPPDPVWARAYEDWMAQAMLYNGGDGCPPLSQC